MSFDDIDEEFKKIIQKADQQFTKEQLKEQRRDELTSAREKDGRYKVAIQQMTKKIDDLKDRMEQATKIFDQHQAYFETVFDPTIEPGEKLTVLQERIPGYEKKARKVYFPVMEKYHALVGQRGKEELEEELAKLEEKLEGLELLREKNQELIMQFLKHIDRKIEELK